MRGLLEDLYCGWNKFIYQEQSAKDLAKIANQKADAMEKAAELDAEESALQVALATSQEEADQAEEEEKAEKEEDRVQTDKKAMADREREAEAAQAERQREMKEIIDTFRRWKNEKESKTQLL